MGPRLDLLIASGECMGQRFSETKMHPGFIFVFSMHGARIVIVHVIPDIPVLHCTNLFVASPNCLFPMND
jgi:hypothetical protein